MWWYVMLMRSHSSIPLPITPRAKAAPNTVLCVPISISTPRGSSKGPRPRLSLPHPSVPPGSNQTEYSTTRRPLDRQQSLPLQCPGDRMSEFDLFTGIWLIVISFGCDLHTPHMLYLLESYRSKTKTCKSKMHWDTQITNTMYISGYTGERASRRHTYFKFLY